VKWLLIQGLWIPHRGKGPARTETCALGSAARAQSGSASSRLPGASSHAGLGSSLPEVCAPGPSLTDVLGAGMDAVPVPTSIEPMLVSRDACDRDWSWDWGAHWGCNCACGCEWGCE